MLLKKKGDGTLIFYEIHILLSLSAQLEAKAFYFGSFLSLVVFGVFGLALRVYLL